MAGAFSRSATTRAQATPNYKSGHRPCVVAIYLEIAMEAMKDHTYAFASTASQIGDRLADHAKEVNAHTRKKTLGERIRRWLGLPTEAERQAQVQLLRDLSEGITAQNNLSQEALRILRSWDAKGVPSTRYEQL